jgi:hypothetical protein
MVTRTISPVVLVAFLFIGVLRADDTSSPSFNKLRDALAFIDSALDKEDWNRLTQALYPPFKAEDRNRNWWLQLKSERGRSHLIDDFRNESFPSTGDTLVIGASPFVGAQMVGWSRIRFMKFDDGWHLNAIYVAR